MKANFLRYFILGLIFSAIGKSSFAQTDTEFWFVAPEVSSAHGDQPIYMRLTSFDDPANVTISQPANPTFIPIILTIPAFGTISLDLTPYKDIIENKPPNQVNLFGLHIQSSKSITAYYEEANDYNSDIFTLKGRNSLGKTFFIPTQNSFANDSRFNAYNSFDIVSTEDSTVIQITPSNNIVGHVLAIPFTVVLNKGQTYSAQATSQSADKHLMGSKVVASKPIAITIKDDSVNVFGGADLNGDQIVPVNVIGNEYVIVRGYLAGSVDDRVYLVSPNSNNRIYLNGSPTPVATLNSGGIYSFSISVSNPVAYLTSDTPVYALHLTGFDFESASALLPSLKCTGSSRVAFTRTSSDSFTLTLVVKDGAQGNFSIDGNKILINASQFNPVPGTANPIMVYARIQFPISGIGVGPHIISNSSDFFTLGIINASPGNVGCRYGYFSDYSRLNLGPDFALCKGDPKVLDAGNGWTSYLWSTGATTQTITVTNPGSYWVASGDLKCLLRDTIKIDQLPEPTLNSNSLIKKIKSGEGTSISLISNQVSTGFTWSAKGSSDLVTGYSSGLGSKIDQVLLNSGTAIETVTYTVTPYNSFCTGIPVDIVISVVSDSQVSISIPNAFSPNGDGFNDIFGPVTKGVSSLEMSISDRNGRIVHKIDQVNGRWDGLMPSGSAAPQGIYFYLLKAFGYDELEYIRQGNVNLYRDQVNLAPNPVKSSAVLNLRGRLSGEKTIAVYSTAGILIRTFNTAEDIICLDFTSLNSGLYFIKASDSYQRIDVKFIKE